MVEQPAGAAVPAPSTSISPRGEIGVLLVHGIGDHQEGETLTSFGEPLVDWIREWLRADGKQKSRGEAGVPAARLRATRTEAESPAYAELELRAPSRASAAGDLADERWLLCEAWWGGSVQPPQSLKLLSWMWTRGPLLIYWHIYIGLGRRGELMEPVSVGFSLWAFLLAGLCQLLVTVAIVLYVVPIGPWRRAVVATVRALTLTLGDSYVLLEHDIQRGALVQRVRQSLAWLEERVDRVIVLAHSQGGAIAHEALRTRGIGKVRLFLSVGSGLEKLQFLRAVRELRRGLVPASTIFPIAAFGLALLVAGLRGEQRVMTATGALLLMVALVIGVLLGMTLDEYRDVLTGGLDGAALPGLSARRWIDVHASHDVVPMGRRSVFTRARFLTRGEMFNERSLIHDHTSYFDNRADFLSPAWQAMSRLSSLRLFGRGERGLLRRHAIVHRHYVRVLAASHGVFVIAAVALAVAVRHQLVAVGASVVQSVGGLPSDLLRPVRVAAAAMASLIDRIWPGGIREETLADAFFGATVLFGTLVVTWLAFKGFWRLRCRARWRKSCRRVDVLDTRASLIRHALGCSAFGFVGFTPLLIAMTLAFAPQALTPQAISEAIAATFAGVALLLAFGYLAGSPWVTSAMWTDRSNPLLVRMTGPLWVFFFAVLLEQLALWLRPGWNGDAIFVTMCIVGSAAWHVNVLTSRRAVFGAGWCVFALALPPLATLAARQLMGGAALSRLAAVWFAATLAAMAIALGWVLREVIAKELRVSIAPLHRLLGRLLRRPTG